MHSIQFSFLIAVFSLGTPLGPINENAVDKKDWNQITLLDDSSITVRFKLRQRVNPGERDWIQFEFENKTDRPLIVTDGKYKINHTRRTLKSERQTCTGGLAWGNYQELFDGVLDPATDGFFKLPPKAKRQLSAQPSDACSASLLRQAGHPWRLWSEEGCDRINLFPVIELELSDGRSLHSPPDLKLSMDWPYPGSADINRMKARLRELFTNPVHVAPDNAFNARSVLLLAFLEYPDVSQDISPEELVEGYKRHLGFANGNATSPGYIVSFFKKRFPNELTLSHFQSQMKNAEQLCRSSAPWDKNHMESFVLLYESNPLFYGWCLNRLFEHREDWIASSSIPTRLAQATRKNIQVLNRHFNYLNNVQKDEWLWGISRLSKCGDKTEISVMLPALDDLSLRNDYKLFSGISWPLPPPPFRVCDFALHAILTILDGSEETAYRQAGYSMIPINDPKAREKLHRLRDEMIKSLRKRLDQGIDSSSPKSQQPEKESRLLSGTWKTLFIMRNGKEIRDPALLESRTMIIKHDRYTLRVEGQTIIGKLEFIPGTMPQAMTFRPASGKYADQALLAIYEIDAQTLRICAAPPGNARPIDFYSRPGSKHDLFVYEKLKPAK